MHGQSKMHAKSPTAPTPSITKPSVLSFTYKPPMDGIETFLTIENVLDAPPPIIGGSLGAVHYNGMPNKDTTSTAASIARVSASSSNYRV